MAEKINLTNPFEVEEIKGFLEKFDLDFEKGIDYTVAVRRDSAVVATCSKAGNVLKCFAVDDSMQGEGVTNIMIKNLQDKLFEEGIFHSFIFTLKLAAEAVKGMHGIICAPTPEAAAELLSLARDEDHALAVTGPDLDALAGVAAKLRDQGFMNLLLSFQTHSAAERFQTGTIVRRAAVRDGYKPLGFPFLRFIDAGNVMDETVDALTEITRYGGVAVLPSFDPAQLAALLTLSLAVGSRVLRRS